MFLVRRIYQVQPGQARQAATYLNKLGKAYEEAGTRGPSTVYFNSGTTPGDKDSVVMAWTDPELRSAYRDDRVRIDTSGIMEGFSDIAISSRIEFWEMMTDEKELD
jgi:hypothetical protein